ncbi:MAG: hypothetical protein L7S62_08930 [Flavobacteriales bacterium]|nr:hypothetical protein [Flavobacteriales bacterium]
MVSYVSHAEAIKALADAIQRLADVELAQIQSGDLQKAEAAEQAKLLMMDTKANFEAQCMDEAGLPSKFKLRCSICGELGRNTRTHQDEMRDGTHHWVEVKI